MSAYTAPLREIRFLLDEVAGLGAIAALPGFEECTPDLVESILAEAAKIAANTLAPLNRVGDLQCSRLVDGKATTPEGWAEAWQVLAEGGWNGLPLPVEQGGMGLPGLLNIAVHEMWQSANMAFALCPMLLQGAGHAIDLFGSEDQKARYLPRLVTGEWTGTMNITEPQAGSDMAAIRARAEPEGDHYRITGQKIFITYGDHDIAENIVHLVLARLPDAPPGIKGISLFIVPKVMPDGRRNDVSTMGLEHKLGIHGSPTAALSFGENGGAWGELMGEPHRGVEYMFTMMNHARLNVALQGPAIAERAYQQALSYARERVQGKPAGWAGAGPVPILHHPDVRRMLMGMKSRVEAMRGIVYTAAAALDIAHAHPDADERTRAQRLAELLIPIAKGWCTETGQTVASTGVQVHGGMGFVEETGAAQHLRDARITTIYEGTTAIQANDLMFRKVLRDEGKAVSALLDQVGALGRELADGPLAAIGRPLSNAAAQTAGVVAWLVARRDDPGLAAAIAVPFLEMMGLVMGGHALALAARAAQRSMDEAAAQRSIDQAAAKRSTDEAAAKRSMDEAPSSDPFLAAKPVTARFFAEHVLPQVLALATIITTGAASVMTLDDEQM